jgi:hypothetical protein
VKLPSDDPLFAFQGRLIELGGYVNNIARVRYVVIGVYLAAAVPLVLAVGVLLGWSFWGVVYPAFVSTLLPARVAGKLNGEIPVSGFIATVRCDLHSARLKWQRHRATRLGHTRTKATTLQKKRKHL